AETVLIWLGPAADHSDLAFQYINRVFGQLRRCPSSTLRKYSEDQDYTNLGVDFPSIFRDCAAEAPSPTEQDSSREESVEFPDLDDEEQYAFETLMARPW